MRIFSLEECNSRFFVGREVRVVNEKRRLSGGRSGGWEEVEIQEPGANDSFLET